MNLPSGLPAVTPAELLPWLRALGVFLGVATGVFLARRWLVRRAAAWAAATDSRVDDVIAAAIQGLRPGFGIVVGALAASQLIPADAPGRGLLTAGLGVLVVLQLAVCGHRAIGAAVRVLPGTGDAGAPRVVGSAALTFAVRLVFWSVVALVTLDTLGIDVTALVAGLGVGGIAVALAVQNILGDLFASLALALDKPFVIGDFIVVGEFMGTVEHVGLKTTQVRSLSGEQVIVPNSDLLGSRLRNYKRMQERRVVLGFGVTYSTPPESLAAIPDLVRDIVTAEAGTRFERAHFSGFGASSLDFEAVYHVLSPDYGRYMDVQQAVNLALLRACAARGIDFAFPTQTIHLQRQPASAR